MIYKFKKGSRITGVDPQKVGEKLEQMRERDGGLQTEDVLAEAKKKRSPLHNGFEWDDAKAGHQYRLIQARQMIRALVVEREDSDEPAYVHIQADESNYYQSVSVACRNVSEWQLAHSSAITRLRSASESLDSLDAVARRIQHENSGQVRDVKDTVARAAEQLQSV